MMTPEVKQIYLVGFMGAGKTAIAKETKRLFFSTFVEMDQVLEEREGMTINEIFAEKGEDYFRLAESILLKELSEYPKPLIVSCGGGIVKNPKNIEIMKATGVVFYLKASAETIYKRLKDTNNRPLLAEKMDVESIQALMDERAPLYEAAADYTLVNDGVPVREIAEKVGHWYRAWMANYKRVTNTTTENGLDAPFANDQPLAINPYDPEYWKPYMQYELPTERLTVINEENSRDVRREQWKYSRIILDEENGMYSSFLTDEEEDRTSCREQRKWTH